MDPLLICVLCAPQVTTFQELLLLRVGFAAAQATQNPICFSLIPELFPRERTTAMAAYNSAIYMGRALSFAAVIIAGQLGVTHSTTESVGVQLARSLLLAVKMLWDNLLVLLPSTCHPCSSTYCCGEGAVSSCHILLLHINVGSGLVVSYVMHPAGAIGGGEGSFLLSWRSRC